MGPEDSWLDRKLHRRLSGPISRMAVAAGLSANVITLVGLAGGAGAAVSVSLGTPASVAVGLALYALAVVLDHADGEVARLTGTCSLAGHRLDLTADTLVHGALAGAMGVAAWRAGCDEALATGTLAALGIVGSALVVGVVRPASPEARPGGLGRVLDALANRHAFYGLLGAFLVLLLAAPESTGMVVWVGAVGAHTYWLGGLGLWLTAGRRRLSAADRVGSTGRPT